MDQVERLGSNQIGDFVGIGEWNVTSPVWQHVLGQQGVNVNLRPSFEKAIHRGLLETREKARNRSI